MTDPLATAALQVRDAAKAHKRLSAHHRREAQRLMSAYADLAAECARRGIRLNIESEDSKSRRNNARSIQNS